MTNSADPDQLASSEANWSGSTLFAKTGQDVFSKRRDYISTTATSLQQPVLSVPQRDCSRVTLYVWYCHYCLLTVSVNRQRHKGHKSCFCSIFRNGWQPYLKFAHITNLQADMSLFIIHNSLGRVQIWTAKSWSRPKETICMEWKSLFSRKWGKIF